MPRVVHAAGFGGFSGRMRRRYTARECRGIVAKARHMQEAEGVTLRYAASWLGVSHSLLSKWSRRHAEVGDVACLRKKSVCAGPLTQLKAIEEPLLRFIFEMREQGMSVSTLMIVIKASKLSNEFAEKTLVARYSAVKRFVRAHSFVYRMGTHVAQRDPEEVRGEAADYMNSVRPLMEGPHRDRRFVLNMDQTPVYFSMCPKKTLEVVGTKTVHIRSSTSDTKRATVAVTIAADGTVLPAVVIFKGKPNGRIKKTEFATYPHNNQYHCQDAAWMDEVVMLAWVDGPLKAYVNQAPDGIIPILILDSYRCHMMSSVVHRIQEMGVEVIHIPGGCTGLCQPVDVGFNKPFKDRVRRLWTDWMIDEGLNSGTTSAPTRKVVAEWIDAVLTEMRNETTIIKNAWMKTGYEWFDYGI